MNLADLFGARRNPTRAEQVAEIADLLAALRIEAVPYEADVALAELGLVWPTTRRRVQRAFAKALLARHPDQNRGVDRGVQQAVWARDVLFRLLQRVPTRT